MKSRVFAVQQPTARDNATGAVKPIMDFTPAAEWGELRFILRDFANPFTAIQDHIAEARRVLKEAKFGPEDWLLLVGNPILIAVVSIAAAELQPRVRMLQWNRERRRYLPVELQL